MRQHKLVDVVNDNDYEILYYPGKENVVVNALSCKAAGAPGWEPFLRMLIDCPLLELIKEAQAKGVKKENWKKERIKGDTYKFSTIVVDIWPGAARFGVQFPSKVWQTVMKEAHKPWFLIPHRATKMYRDLSHSYWCPCMKRHIARYMEIWSTCSMVKAEQKRKHGQLQPLDVTFLK